MTFVSIPNALLKGLCNGWSAHQRLTLVEAWFTPGDGVWCGAWLSLGLDPSTWFRIALGFLAAIQSVFAAAGRTPGTLRGVGAGLP